MTSSHITKIFIIISIFFLCINSGDTFAQRSRKRGHVPVKVKEKQTKFGMTESEINNFFKQSFLFSNLEIALIQKALKGAPPSARNLSLEKINKIPERRVIKISGVLYRGKGDWVVWMNNTKVTPHHLLPEILEIEVKNSSYVRLKWYDIGLNAVISITMRPHQIYDIGTGILLPG